MLHSTGFCLFPIFLMFDNEDGLDAAPESADMPSDAADESTDDSTDVPAEEAESTDAAPEGEGDM